MLCVLFPRAMLAAGIRDIPKAFGPRRPDRLGMDRPLGTGVGFGTTAILTALVCAALVGYLALSHPRAAHDTPALSPATLP
jgi:hypothetical protein